MLRAIAVLAVIGYHAAPERLVNGYLGVDVFFVISGFLVTPKILAALEKDSKSQNRKYKYLKIFYQRRFFRLAPSLFTCLIFTTILVLILVAPRDFEKSFGQMALSLIGLGNVGAWWFSGDYFSPHPSPFIHTWSLAVEEQIYILLPIILLSIKKFFKLVDFRKARLTIILLFSVSIAIQVLLQMLYPAQDSINHFVFYGPVTRFNEFGIGALLATIEQSYKNRKYISVLLLLTIGIVLIFPFSAEVNVLIPILILTVIAIATGTEAESPKFLSPMVAIGNMSYSLYLFHLPLLFIAFYSPIWPDIQGREHLKIIAVLVLFPISYINYRFYERKWIQASVDASSGVIIFSLRKWIGLPFMLCCIIFVGSSYSFFGLDPNQKPLPDPSLALGDCYSLQGEHPCPLRKVGGGEKILLVGDSHARHLSTTFGKVAKRANLSPIVWTQSGCQFILKSTLKSIEWKSLVEKYGTQHLGETQSCFKHNQQIVEWLKRNESTVVLTFRSTSMVENDLGINPVEYRKLALKNIEVLANYVTSLVVIGPNPEYLDHARFFGGGTLIWQKNYESTASSMELKENMRSNPFLDNKYYSKKLFNKEKITYIDGIDPFCSQNVCIRKMNERWLYTDVGHLSIYGTNLYKNLMNNAIIF